jgi:hypothetical protein
MAVNGIGAPADRRSSVMSRSAQNEAPPVEPRALVPVPPVDPSENTCPYSRRPAAPFLAHLIATKRGEPQTRERRRAEPDAAAQAYAATATLR